MIAITSLVLIFSLFYFTRVSSSQPPSIRTKRATPSPSDVLIFLVPVAKRTNSKGEERSPIQNPLFPKKSIIITQKPKTQRLMKQTICGLGRRFRRMKRRNDGML